MERVEAYEHQSTIEPFDHFERVMKNDQTLSSDRTNLYGHFSSVYIQIPDQGTLMLDWDPAFRILDLPLEGAEEAQQEMREGLRRIRDYLSHQKLHFKKSLINLTKDWTHLLRGVDKGGPLPPYESVYRTGRLQNKPAQEVYRLFSKMGIRLPEEWHQPPDYVGVELDFMRLLCQKERTAWEKNNLELIREVVGEEHSFLENHLSLWIFDFCGEMVKQSQEEFFRGIARVTSGFVGYDRLWTSHLLQMT